MRCVYTPSNTFLHTNTNNVALWTSLGLMALGVTTVMCVSRQQREAAGGSLSVRSPHSRSPDSTGEHSTEKNKVCKTSIQTFTDSYVNRLVYNAVSVVGRRLWRRANWMDIVSRAKDATTVVFSRDTWFADLCRTVATSTHHITGVSVRCPLTLRVTDGDSDVSHSVLLNAFVEYDIRLDPNRGTPPPDSVNAHSYQTSTASLIESILVSEYSKSVLKSVTCKMTCELCDTSDLAELVGLPLADVAVAQVASRLLIPQRWSFESINELCQFVYAQCSKNTTHTLSSLTPDRVVKMFSHADSDDDDDDEDEDEDEVASATTASISAAAAATPATFFEGPLVAILCHWVHNTADAASTVEEAIHSLVRRFSGKCVVHNASCGVLVSPKKAMALNAEIHALAHKNDTTLQSFVVQVQNRASVSPKPRLTHVTMVEVI